MSECESVNDRCIYLQKNTFGWPLVTVLVYQPLGAHIHLLVKKVGYWPYLDKNKTIKGRRSARSHDNMIIFEVLCNRINVKKKYKRN